MRVFITGIPRSGTSLCAGLVSLTGLPGGDTVPGNKNNPKGFFENNEVRAKVIKPFLSACGVDPMGQWPLPASHQKYPGDLRGEITDILGEEFYYKEPKLLLMWRQFHEAFPEAKWIFVYRDHEDILDSVMRTPFMRRFVTRDEWKPWLQYHLKERDKLIETVKPHTFFPHMVLNGDYSEVKELEDFLGLPIPEEKAKDFIEPSLWKRTKY